MGAVEVLAKNRRQTWLALGVVATCLALQLWNGPVSMIRGTVDTARQALWAAGWRREMLAQIPPDASVTAGLPYLSHLAARVELISLHHVLKGLRTLSHERFEMPHPTEFVVVDYGDRSTFSREAGFYHEARQLRGGSVVPSSDRLLFEYFAQEQQGNSPRQWSASNCNEFSIYRHQAPAATVVQGPGQPGLNLDNANRLDSYAWNGLPIRRADGVAGRTFALALNWKFTGERNEFPWMVLALTDAANTGRHLVIKGLCVPVASAPTTEEWRVLAPPSLPEGAYSARLYFYNNLRINTPGLVQSGSNVLCGIIEIGSVRVE
jgi:hypothetical protein